MARTIGDFIASLNKAIASGNNESVMKVVKAGRVKGEAIFVHLRSHAAAIFSKFEKLKYLMAREAILEEAKEGIMNTPLYEEAQFTYLEILKLLVRVEKVGVDMVVL